MALSPGSIASYNIAPGQSQADVDLRRKVALSFIQQGSDASPVRHWTQGAARVAQALLGGYQLQQLDQEDQADRSQTRAAMGALMGGDQPGIMPNQAPIDPTLPRGLRNNNPLNLEASQFTQNQPGFQGSDGRFGKFATMQDGTKAADALLASYGNRGINTVGGVVNRWAPPSDNNPTNTYASTVAKALGTTPDAPINLADATTRQKLVQAMGQFENGRAIPVAPVGTATDQPRGGMSDPRRAQAIQALSQTRSGAPFAQAIFAKQFEQEQNRVRPLNEDEKKVYPGAVAVKASGEPVFPPPSTNVNLNAQNTAETTYSKGKAEDALGLERSADKTMSERQQLEVFKNLTQQFQTGKLAPTQMTAGAWADALGIDPKMMEKIGVPPNAAINGQLIDQMSNQMTLGMIGNKNGEGGMPANNFSDADRKFLTATAPGIARTPGANAIMLEMKSRGLDRNLEKVHMWDQYRSDGKSYENFERDWRKHVNSQPSLFADIPDRIKALSAEQAPPDRGAIEEEMRRRKLIP